MGYPKHIHLGDAWNVDNGQSTVRDILLAELEEERVMKVGTEKVPQPTWLHPESTV